MAKVGDSWLSSAQIKVTPEQMAAKAADVSVKINNIKGRFASLEQRVSSTNGYWKGDANDMYRSKYREFKEVTDEIIKRLEEHVRDLNTMAGVYETAEKEVLQIIEDLPTDIIS